MTRGPDESKEEALAAEAITAMVAASVSALEPHLGVAIAGCAPYIAEGLAHLFTRALQRQGQVVSWASQRAGMHPNNLLRNLLSDPRGEQMLRHALGAARNATLDAKIKVIAKSLAVGALATDDALVDTEILFLRTMEELEVPHVRALKILASPEASLAAGHSGHPQDKTPVSFSYTHLKELLPRLETALDPILATLEMHGLIARIATGGGPFLGGEGASTVWQITDFGIHSLRRLEEWPE